MKRSALEIIQDYSDSSEDDADNAEAGSMLRGKTKRQVKSVESHRKKRLQHYAISTGCNKCQHGCKDKIGWERQRIINEAYWDRAPQDQKTFIRECVVKSDVQRRRIRFSQNAGERRREFTLKYFLTDSQHIVQQVCAVYFLNTLGYEANSSDLGSSSNYVQTDERGAWKKRIGSIQQQAIKNDIMRYNPTISHYRRIHAPKRLYLPSDLSARKMYDTFIENQEDDDTKCSYTFYCRVIKELNITFTKLGQEECEVCQRNRLHVNVSDHNPEVDAEDVNIKCGECQNWFEHHNLALICRAEYERDKSNQKALVMSVDLQKVATNCNSK